MSIIKEKLQHINTITHEGKVLLIATDADGTIWYTIKQDGFEDSYLNTPAELRTGWESWQKLELPNEADDQSVIDKETEELTDSTNPSTFILRSRYRTQAETAVAPVQLISALGHIYIFRQSKTNTLLVDRFVLDGMTNKLNRKLEVRFKRSRQKHKPIKNMNKEVSGLSNIDSLDFRDANGKFFYEPTTELCVVNNLDKGWFSVVLVPTIENDVYRWHIFAYNNQTKKVELTTMRVSDQGLFDVQDYTVFVESNDSLIPRRIPGIIKRTIDLGSVTVVNGLSATKYDIQREKQTDGGMQLLRDSTKIMLAIPTSNGNVAAFSFAIANDGLLSQISVTPNSKTWRNTVRQMLLPLNTLENVKAIGTTTPPPQGKITALQRGEDDAVNVLSSGVTNLDAKKINQIKITGTQNYNSFQQSITKIDDNTFEIPSSSAVLGNWEVIPAEETGLIFNGAITAYEVTSTGKIKITAANHGLNTGEGVQILDTREYNGTYIVQKINDKTFSLNDIKWQAGTAVNLKLQSQKRRGLLLDGVDDYVQLPPESMPIGNEITVSFWAKGGSSLPKYNSIIYAVGDNNERVLNIHLPWDNDIIYFDCGVDAIGYDRIEKAAKSVEYKGEWVHWAFTKNAKTGEMKIYRNGTLWHNGTNKNKPLPKTAVLHLGKVATANRDYYDGTISELCIWKVARTEAQIKDTMYLQLMGKEVGLVGYWRLGAIVEDKKQRQVVDFSVNGNNGVVYGGACVSDVILPRNLAGTSTPAIKYENEELFAVSENATYEEEFEFKVTPAVDPNNVDGQNGKIFALVYKGKTNRSAIDWVNITPTTTEFTNLDRGYYKAKCRFNVPKGVSLVRSFGIGNIKGTWTTLEIRKHLICLLSDSITETKYTDSVTLATLADNHSKLAVDLKEIKSKELKEVDLLIEKRKLELEIAGLNISGPEKQAAINAKKTEISNQETIVNNLKTEIVKSEKIHQEEIANPLNYWCKLVCRVNESWIARIYTQSKALLYADVGANGKPYYSNNYFKFQPTSGGYYQIICQYENRALVGLIKNQVQSIDPTGIAFNIPALEWKPQKILDGYYLIAHKNGGVLDRGGSEYGVCVWEEHQSLNQQWKIVRIGEEANSRIRDAKSVLDNKKNELAAAEQELTKLKNELSLLELFGEDQTKKKAELQKRLDIVNAELAKIQAELNILNANFLKGLKTTQQTPQAMPQIAKDDKGLVTQGAFLGFVSPASRLNAMETCEGNVQLSYFDTQGRMQLTNYDAASDSSNTAFEQWLPDAQRACLNFSDAKSIVTLNPQPYLSTDWSIEAWFFYPLPETAQWNTLIRGNLDNHIIVNRNKKLGIYLTNDPLKQNFYDSGFSMELLSIGWHHLTAVGKGDTTRFYIDGKQVGDTKAKALADAEASLKVNPNDTAAKQKVKDIKNASLKVTTNVYAIGNKPTEFEFISQFVKFDGANNYIQLPDSPVHHPSQFTFSCWVYYEGGRQGIVVDSSDISQKKGYMIYIASDNKVCCNIGDGNKVQVATTSSSVTLNSLTHITGTYDGSILKLYLNGKADGTPLTTAYAPNISQGLIIGAIKEKEARGVFFKGQIGKVCIWDKALTEQEIQVVMNEKSSITGTEPNLVAYYPLNQIKVEGTSKKVLDLVGKNHGTLLGVVDKTLSTSSLSQGEEFGKVAEVRIWEIALSDEEIAVNSKTLISGNESGLLAYYPLNEATGNEVRDYSRRGSNGTVSGANWWGCTAPIGYIDNSGISALVSTEYSSIIIDPITKVKSAIMRRFFAYPGENKVNLLPDKRIETLELKWIGNAIFAPTLLGYMEGPPPVPSENLTLADDYNGATSVELTMSEDVEFKWNRTQEGGLGANFEIFAGAETESSAGLFMQSKIATMRLGFKGKLDFSYNFLNESNITSKSSLSMTDKLQLRGTPEQNPKFPHLGKRFIPKNIGYALVISALADVFITRLARSGKMLGYQVRPVDGIPPDVNTITFLMNPAYTMNGSLDGMTGSSATSDRFFKHVPEMRSQYGSLYPASYYRLQEAYELKRQIEAEDKRRESYFSNFDVRLLDEISLNRNIDSGDAASTVGVKREEDKPSTDMTKEAQEKAEKENLANIKADAKAKTEEQSKVVKAKQEEIKTKINDEEQRVNATASFAGWQKRMEAIQIKAGKRNIINTYVWDADGGLRTEAQSFANTVEHTIGGSFSLNAALGLEGKFGAVAKAELTAQATVNLTQTMSKTETRSKGFGLNIDLSGVENKSITDYKDDPILPGEKVDRYRFMSFYLESSTQHFHDFFNYVVDPEWLASNDEEARALRQTQAGKPNKTWRVLHRVTYVERPALMGFGRDIRQLDIKPKNLEIDKLHNQVADLQKKIDQVIQLINSQKP